MVNASPALAPKISVIMNCFNGEKYLQEAIESVFAQRFTDWEIVFFDNASTDRSGEIAQGFGPKLRYFRNHKTVNLGAARNEAIKLARGEFVAFLDCDDVWLPAKLERQVALFDDPEVGLVYCDAILFNEAGDSRRMYSYRRFATGYCFGRLLVDYFLSMQTVVVRRIALDAQEHWFDPRFNAIEEADLFRRIALNWKLNIVPDALGKWRVHEGSITWSKAHLFAIENEILLAKFHEMIPNFAQRYAQEISVFKRHIAKGKAMHEWRQGRPRNARRLLTPHIFRDWKSAALFGATMMPESLLGVVQRAIGSVRIVPKRKGEKSAVRGRQELSVSTVDEAAVYVSTQVRASGSSPWLRYQAAVALTPGLTWLRPLLANHGELRCVTYHDVPPQCLGNFREQITLLAKHYRIIDHAEFCRRLTATHAASDNAVLLTFDDAFYSNRAAAQVLDEFGIKATFFVPTGFVNCRSHLEWNAYICENLYSGSRRRDQLPSHLKPMSWADIERLVAAGHTIGSHTCNHRRPDLSRHEPELMDELVQSGDELQRRLGQKIDAFAFPFGHLDSITSQALKLVGRRYETAFSSIRGDNWGVHPLGIRRETVSPAEPATYVLFQTAGGLAWHYRKQRRLLDAMLDHAGFVKVSC